MSKSQGIYPQLKRDRKAKMNKLKHYLTERLEDFNSIDRLLSTFCIEENITFRQLREEYIKMLLLEGSIDKSIFKDSVLITKKFITRLKV